jgi:hypothetical protein
VRRADYIEHKLPARRTPRSARKQNATTIWTAAVRGSHGNGWGIAIEGMRHRAVADVVGAGNLAHGLAVAVAAANRFSLLVFGGLAVRRQPLGPVIASG